MKTMPMECCTPKSRAYVATWVADPRLVQARVDSIANKSGQFVKKNVQLSDGFTSARCSHKGVTDNVGTPSNGQTTQADCNL